MRFFQIALSTLSVIFIINILYVVVEMSLRDPVFACKDVTVLDPIDVRKLCKRKTA